MDAVFLLILALVFFSACAAVVVKMFSKPRSSEPLEINHAELEAAERNLRESSDADWVVLKRCHGPAYNHGAMAELVAALLAEGIDATYDVVSTSSADGGVTNFMLKVTSGNEERALEVLSQLK